MFESHPVPQQISSYQFRLIGDMTLKQFSQLGGGALISLLVYASPFPAFLKWPLVIFFAIAGAALAFLPFEERPLDQWVFAFFRSIYSPTLFTWQKAQKLQYYQEETTSTATPTNTEPTVPSPAEQSLVSKNSFLTNLEDTEKDFLTRFSSLFSFPAQKTPSTQQQTVMTPVPPPANKTVAIPINQPQKIDTHTAATTQTIITPQVTAQTTGVSQTLSPTTQGNLGMNAQFSPEAAPPMPPSQPNVIVGQIMDSNKKIVDGAILEIKDVMGRPVRALRTNKLGHFLIVTPLPNGKYQLIAEKDGLHFKPINLETVGTIIPPIAIHAEGNQL